MTEHLPLHLKAAAARVCCRRMTDTYRPAFVALANYLLDKGADAESAVELEDGVVLWAKRQGESDVDFHCAVLTTDEARQLMVKRLYERLNAALAPPYSPQEVEAFEQYHGLRLPSLLRFYLLQVSRQTVGGDVHLPCHQLPPCRRLVSAITPEQLADKWVPEPESAAALGAIPFADNGDQVVVTGVAAGHVLVRAADASGAQGYALCSLWDALYRPFLLT